MENNQLKKVDRHKEKRNNGDIKKKTENKR